MRSVTPVVKQDYDATISLSARKGPEDNQIRNTSHCIQQFKLGSCLVKWLAYCPDVASCHSVMLLHHSSVGPEQVVVQYSILIYIRAVWNYPVAHGPTDTEMFLERIA